MTPWPLDVPRPSRAPSGEHDARPASRLPFRGREAVLADALRGAAEELREMPLLVARIVLGLVGLYTQERDAARADVEAAQTHAASALHALDLAADRAVLAEAKLAGVRAALPALASAVATGRRADVARSLDALTRALR